MHNAYDCNWENIKTFFKCYLICTYFPEFQFKQEKKTSVPFVFQGKVAVEEDRGPIAPI